ncbi:heme lyase NrfEFG subunit NrfE [Volucribacter amazonae]|uniref:Cytochrome C biogenesis protein CcmF n=1 Tax=Volucribacter amazonae TaxID=256731 RepID=A0A9X4PBR6_9PAST|nr:heme lyase NrfEFG subunit NrfE [Volucribacter amazonae]MDG6894744.1 cytochrome C biogenesis protein CcmF [Volucribacter amazonae]
MIAELGFIALVFATVCALLLSILPHIGIYKHNAQLISSAWNLSYLVALFSIIAIACLVYAFVLDDFSLEYVASHSNSQLPLLFKIGATWGGHEGSMLFWLFALSLWLTAFAWQSRRYDPLIAARSLAILGLICLAFCLFILLLSNPFNRLFPSPLEGRDLNPMLQDIGLIFHPPLLYFGYVGFAVNFALTLAGLLSGHLDAALARWIRPWVLVSWLFLTLGIALGSWWAYYELGWGGWWFWDPVENASLMPWLVGLGLLHSLIATQQRGIFSYWTILLSIFAFALSVLGTFIVRSGALTSVHAFAIDSARGGALLLLFFLLLVVALSLFAFKVKLVKSPARFPLLSKESLLLFANLLFSVATLCVFLGTFYPMLFSTLGLGSISVGAPYFNSLFMPIIILALLAMLLALLARWKKVEQRRLSKLSLLLLPALGLSSAIIMMQLRQEASLTFHLTAFIFVSLAFWLLLACLWQNWFRLPLQRKAMLVAHIGVAITVIGAVMNSYYGSEIGVRLKPEQSAVLNGYEFRYLGFRNELGKNFTSEKAIFHIYKNNQKLTALYPERRHYDVRTMNMSEVGLQRGWFGDLYIVMGDKLAPNEFAFRLHYKPFVPWLWLGGLCMATGALLGVLALRKQRNE